MINPKANKEKTFYSLLDKVSAQIKWLPEKNNNNKEKSTNSKRSRLICFVEDLQCEDWL